MTQAISQNTKEKHSKRLGDDREMNAMLFLQIMKKYGKCPDCGSEKLGNGEGTLEVDDDTFKRTCKCGFEKVIREGE
jgi:hypothetical protein